MTNNNHNTKRNRMLLSATSIFILNFYYLTSSPSARVNAFQQPSSSSSSKTMTTRSSRAISNALLRVILQESISGNDFDGTIIGDEESSGGGRGGEALAHEFYEQIRNDENDGEALAHEFYAQLQMRQQQQQRQQQSILLEGNDESESHHPSAGLFSKSNKKTNNVVYSVPADTSRLFKSSSLSGTTTDDYVSIDSIINLFEDSKHQAEQALQVFGLVLFIYVGMNNIQINYVEPDTFFANVDKWQQEITEWEITFDNFVTLPDKITSSSFDYFNDIISSSEQQQGESSSSSQKGDNSHHNQKQSLDFFIS